MAYNYGPPPPAPPPTPPQGGGGYPPYYPQPPPRGGYAGHGSHGSHGGRGRGGHHSTSDRGQIHSATAGYNYSGQQHTSQPYGAPSGAPYGGQHLGSGGYVAQQAHHQAHPPPAMQPPMPAWQHDQQQQHQGHHQAPPQAPLTAANYHPNYAPQLYQHPAPPQPGPPLPLPQTAHHQTLPPHPYNGQPPYAPVSHPQYGQGYSQSPMQHGQSAQPWGQGPQAASAPTHLSRGRGRGGGGGGGERGVGSVLMGPPIRWGFDNGSAQGPAAPVSTSFSPPVYGGPQGHAAPYPSGLPNSYTPHTGSYMPGAPQRDHRPPRQQSQGRGGMHGHQAMHKHRPHDGGDKTRNRSRGSHAPAQPSHPTKPDSAANGKKKKRKTNTLGLVPGEDTEEDDENEEERLNDMYGADAPNPTTAADIEEWIAARRARFPTKARIESRKAAAKKQNGDAGKADALEQQAEKLRKQLEQVESSIKRKREQQDEGDDERDVDLAAPSSDEAKSENGRLEVQATRHDAAVLAASQRKADPTRHCKYYSTGGTCGKKGKCRFVHDPSVREAALKEREKNGGRMTLQQRLTLNDKDQEDLTIVQTLKYLQDRGLLENSGSDGAGTAADRVHSQPSQTPIKERLNSLPPIPPKSVPKV